MKAAFVRLRWWQGAWQFPGEEIRITPQRSERLNVFGFLSRGCEARRWTCADDDNGTVGG